MAGVSRVEAGGTELYVGQGRQRSALDMGEMCDGVDRRRNASKLLLKSAQLA